MDGTYSELRTLLGDEMRQLFKILRDFIHYDARISIGIMGVVVAVIGLQTVVGYIFNEPTAYTWSGPIGMALNTGISFVLTGTAITYISLSDKLWK